MFNAPSTRIRFCLKGIFSPFKKSASTRCVFESFLPVHIQTIMHLVYPQNFCMVIFSNFFWVLRSSLEKKKTIVMQNLRGIIRCIVVYVKMVTEEVCTSFVEHAHLLISNTMTKKNYI